ncbi:uncharacterized protein LOC116290795 [Actinia tenebrosa]|uniref:Uncharacterized protein LOC116290795 n=1 Tax=Actinia tenebrosa TaxID=6105 RepID=A0A6P8HBD5_ACTTE|nr:uncharacterized protein LOC116290795 [Actinia tenebrosa]
MLLPVTINATQHQVKLQYFRYDIVFPSSNTDGYTLIILDMAAENYGNPTEQQLNDINDIIAPFLDDTNEEKIEDLSLYTVEPDVQFEVFDLKDIYDKVQKKTAEGSEQRIANGVVNMAATATAQISAVRVFVRRNEKAALKTNDRIGTVELPVTAVKTDSEDFNKTRFSVNLDSVYKNEDGSYVYWLDRVEVEERNIWELAIYVELIDGTQKTFLSKTFRIRTKPRPSAKKSEPSAESTAGQAFNTMNDSQRNEASPPPMLYQESDPLFGPSGNKRKRSSPSVGSYGAVQSPFSIQSGPAASPLSANGNAGYAQSVNSNDVILTDYLEAQRAQIQHLKVQKMISSPNADIAYHLKLEGPYYRNHNLEEGDVMGFFQNKTTGETEISRLTPSNAREARMAGVISRSAYLHGNVPVEGIERTDTVCVIGIVKVKVAGPVQNGERIYASFDVAGVGIPETQIPLRPSGGISPILLGQALESSQSSKLDTIHPVKCFVSVVLGIQSREVSHAVDNVQRHMQRKIADAIRLEKRKFYKGILWKGSIVILFLVLLTYFLYEIFCPGSLFRYWLCKRGSIPNHEMWFTYHTFDEQTPRVHGVEFEWPVLKRKLHLEFKKKNASGMRYYLNLDRCAYGGVVAVASLIDHKKQVRGAEIFSTNSSCDVALYEFDGDWRPYKTGRNFVCKP